MSGAPEQDKGLAHSLGEFFGHVIKGIKTDPAQVAKRVRTEEEPRETPQGTVIIRRTIIEEVRVDPPREKPSDNEKPRAD
jgi:hypothetical protein